MAAETTATYAIFEGTQQVDVGQYSFGLKRRARPDFGSKPDILATFTSFW